MDDSDVASVVWQDLVATLLRRWKVVLIVFAVGMTVTAILAFLGSPTYLASAKLMVTSERARITVSPDPKSGPTVDRVTNEDLNSEVALLQSPLLLREVLEPYAAQMPRSSPSGIARQIGLLLRFPLELPARLYQVAHHVPPVSPFDLWAQSIAAHVSVTPIKASNLIDVSFTGSNPGFAAELVNQLAAHHVERHALLNQQSEALSFLESQRQLLSDRMRQAEETLAKFYDREAIDAASAQRVVLRTRLGEVEASLARSDTELAEATARAEFLTHDIRSHPRNLALEPGVAKNDPVQLIRSRIIELQLQHSDLLSKFAPTSLRVQAVDRQLAEARRLLADEEAKTGGGQVDPTLALELSRAQEQTAAMKARVQALRAQITSYRTTLDHLDQIAPEQERLEQDVATAKESFLTYSKKVEEARFSDALDQSRIVNVSVVERAQVPTAPQPSKNFTTLLLGAIMSLSTGAGLGLLLERIDPRVESAAGAAKASGLRILADIPS